MILYPWLNNYFKQLISYYQTDRSHHSLLIHAMKGIGDEELIYAIVHFLMCQNPKEHNSCKKCHSCCLMQAGTHPDFYAITPEKNNVMIGVDFIREVSEKLYECPRLGRKKIVQITNISLLTEEAVNALLKVIEEPPKHTKFIFSCHELKRLPETLRSRCCLYYLKVPQESCSLAWLEHETKASKITALTALRLCNGAPVAAASTLLKKESFFQRKSFYNSFQKAMENHDWLSLLKELHHSQVTEYFYWIISLFLDALKMQQGALILISNIDSPSLVRKIAHRLSGVTLLTILNDTFNCYEQLFTISSSNRELLLVDQLLRIEYFCKKG